MVEASYTSSKGREADGVRMHKPAMGRCYDPVRVIVKKIPTGSQGPQPTARKGRGEGGKWRGKRGAGGPRCAKVPERGPELAMGTPVREFGARSESGALGIHHLEVGQCTVPIFELRLCRDVCYSRETTGPTAGGASPVWPACGAPAPDAVGPWAFEIRR